MDVREIVRFSPCESREECVFAHVQKQEPGAGRSPSSMFNRNARPWGDKTALAGQVGLAGLSTFFVECFLSGIEFVNFG